MVRRYVELTCDHPGCSVSDAHARVDYLVKEFGWCLSRDRKSCYCPDHAPLHRHCGQTYARFSKVVVTKSVTTTSPSWMNDDQAFDKAFFDSFLFVDE